MNIAKLLKLSWNAPTTDVDGTGLDGPITYEVQFSRGVDVITIETSETLLEIFPLEHRLTPGSWAVAVYSVEHEDGQELRSIASAGIQIELTETSNPNAPTGLALVTG